MQTGEQVVSKCYFFDYEHYTKTDEMFLDNGYHLTGSGTLL